MKIVNIFTQLLDFVVGQIILYKGDTYEVVDLIKETIEGYDKDNEHYNFTLKLKPIETKSIEIEGDIY